MERSDPRGRLGSEPSVERVSQGRTGPFRRAWPGAILLLGALLGLDAWSPAAFDEPLALRWVRVAADHPLRTGLALWLLVRAVLPDGLGTSEPGGDARESAGASRTAPSQHFRAPEPPGEPEPDGQRALHGPFAHEKPSPGVGSSS